MGGSRRLGEITISTGMFIRVDFDIHERLVWLGRYACMHDDEALLEELLGLHRL